MMARAAVGNASDRQQVKSAGQKEKIKERRRAADLHSVMLTAEGRRFVWWLFGQCGINESVMRGGPEMIQFYAGKQDFGHELYARVLKFEPDLYLTMQQESILEQKQEPDDEEEETPVEEDDGS